MDIALLIDIARLLYGDDWQRPLARGLGPFHPHGARESIDDRLVRRWVAGERPVAGWVSMVMLDLMEKRALGLMRRAHLIRTRAEELRPILAPVEDLNSAPRL